MSKIERSLCILVVFTIKILALAFPRHFPVKMFINRFEPSLAKTLYFCRTRSPKKSNIFSVGRLASSGSSTSLQEGSMVVLKNDDRKGRVIEKLKGGWWKIAVENKDSSGNTQVYH
jgi:hypothetical protein